jgi:aspartate/methionine/tyrosine aminotransferase
MRLGSMNFAQRLSYLQSNVFGEMDRAKATAQREIVDLSLGSSDLPAPPLAVAKLHQALDDPATHGYLLFEGTAPFRMAVAQWVELKFGISVDPQTEILPLSGSQEGTALMPLALLDPGDYALLLDPGYPSHAGGVHLAGGQIHTLKLLTPDFLPDFSDIPPKVLNKSKMLVLSYPHNPTTGTATLEFFKEAVAFCQKNGLTLVHDFPYADIAFGGYKPPSIFDADPEKSVSLELYTMSKSYHMGGFRIGYAVGNPTLIKALRQIRDVTNFYPYRGILQAAAQALSGPQDYVTESVQVFQERRDACVEALADIDWYVPAPKATMYLWAKLPQHYVGSSMDFCRDLVRETGVALAPGSGFGASGEGYVRFALVHPPDVLRRAVEAIGAFLASPLLREGGRG